MFERRRTGEGETIFAFSGMLDAASARGVGPLLRMVLPGESVVLDFTRARDVDYYGVAALASEISMASVRVTLSGLSHRHAQLLRYFGIDRVVRGADEGAALGGAERLADSRPDEFACSSEGTAK